jgi:hypothetical protein
MLLLNYKIMKAKKEVVNVIINPTDTIEKRVGEKTEVTVTFRMGTRVYSKEVHGENFMELAKEFCEKQKGTIA